MTRIKDGLRILSDSCNLLFHHLYLLGYTAIAIVGYLVITLIVQWIFPPEQTGAYGASIMYILLSFIRSLFITYAFLLLAHHTVHILEHKKFELPMRHSLLMGGLVWSILLTALALISDFSFYWYSLGVIAALVILLFLFFTSLVIPFIAVENDHLTGAIRHSYNIIAGVWIEALTGSLIIGIIGVIPLWIIELAGLSRLILEWPFICFTYTLYIIFFTLIFFEFYRQPQEEINVLNYPEF